MNNEFRTSIKVSKSSINISHKHKVLLIGSCFTQNIGKKLQQHKFDTLTNPFGIVFNPSSLYTQLRLLYSATSKDLEKFYFQHNNLWHSWQHHSNFSSKTIEELHNKITKRLSEAQNFLKQTDIIIITLGTAYAYEHLENRFIVSNCHKVPNKNFKKNLLDNQKLVADLSNVLTNLKNINPNLKVIFTISPVRHWKDGVVENQRSKANLILTVHELCEQYNYCEYFPSYELVLDDLRDYRFYKADMLHPNQQAVDYIWEKFKNAYFEATTLDLVSRIDKINKSRLHKPRFPKSEQHLAFLAKLEAEEKLVDISIKKG